LDYKNAAATGIGALRPLASDEPYKVFVLGIEGDPGRLTCPECNQTHDYVNADIKERTIA
jgi:hypothetical protein